MATNFAPQISPPLSAEEAASQQEDKPTTPSDAVMGEAADLGAMFRVLDALQPDAAEDTAGKTYRPSFDPWPDGDEDLPPEAEENGEWCAASGGRVSVIGEFERAAPVPVCAVDAGIVRLGETGQDAYIALRGSYVLDKQGARTPTEAMLFRSGLLCLPHGGPDQVQALHALGLSLGQADLYVKMDGQMAVPVAVRGSAAGNQAHFPDRIRNAIERQIQLLAAGAVTEGLLLLDGALSTFDTPPAFLERLVARAHEQGNSIIAVSKRSTLNIGGRPLGFWLEEVPYRACYRALTTLFHQKNAGRRSDRITGRLFACRFSPLGRTYRMDVAPAPGLTDEEALSQFFSSVGVRGGYPDILVQAHALSSITPPQALVLRAQLTQFGLTPAWDWGFGGAFGPFGGAHKS